MDRRGIEITTEAEDFAVLLELAELPQDSSVKDHCIYRVPLHIRQTNEAAYTPRIVSIGPFHRGKHERLKLMEGLKLSYLKSFLQGTGLTMERRFSKLKEWKPRIRNCYAESIPLDSDYFLRMILIDAGFIIELFLRCYNDSHWVRHDPLFLKPWVADDVFHDLILLENQLTFFVLNGLFKLAIADIVTADLPTFLHITLKYFAGLNPQKLQPDEVSVKHFTDLLRIFYLPPIERLPKRSELGNILDHLHCASDLVNAGLKLKVDKTKRCLLDLQYDKVKGVLTMPRLDVSYKTEFHLRNMVAFEQNHYPAETYITDYLIFLDFLIFDGDDVDILIRNGVICTLMRDSNKVATLIGDLSSNLIQPNMNLELLSICWQLNKFCDRPLSKWMANFKTTVSIAAVAALILTLIQTICSVISLFRS